MARRFAPIFSFLLLCTALESYVSSQAGGGRPSGESLLKSDESLKTISRVRRSLSDGDKERINSG